MKHPFSRSEFRLESCPYRIVLIASLVIGSLCPANAEPSALWPMERGDARNTAASAAPGKISQPQIWWEHYLGPPRVERAASIDRLESRLHDLDGDGTPERVRANGRRVAVRDLAGKLLWSYDTPGQTEIAPCMVKIGRGLPGSKGLQLFVASSRMDTGEGYAWCFSFEEGAANGKIAWQTENLTGMHSPEAILADVDNDGRMEFCLAPHYRVLILDAETGAIEHTVKWDVGRNYGLFAAEDIDGDACRELLVICDFVLHIDMIDVAPGGAPAKLAWSRRFIEGTQFDGARQIYLHAGQNALADLDGDGAWEIWFNVFNQHGDGKWHLQILNANTGGPCLDEPGLYLLGAEDLDGNGLLEIVALSAEGQRPADLATLVIFEYEGGMLFPRAHRGRLKPILTDKSPPDHIASNADDGARGLLLAGRRFFALTGSGGASSDTLLAFEFDGVLKEKGRYAAPGAWLDVLSLEGEGSESKLVIRDARTGERRELTLDLKPIGDPRPDPAGGFTAVPIVADLGVARPAIVLPASGDEILALVQDDAGNPKQFWRAPGRGMTLSTGYSNANRGVLAADLDGDGDDEIVAAHRSPAGNGTLRALRADGSLFWEHEFSDLVAGGLEAGVDLWAPGRFTGRKGADLWVSVHRGSKGSAESYALDGRDGRELWNIKTVDASDGGSGKVSRPFGSVMPFIADVDADGIDDIGMCPYEIYSVTRGSDGKHVIGPLWTLAPQYFGRWLAYFSPTLADLDYDGALDVFFNSASNTSGGVGAIALDGKPRYVKWHDNPTGCASFQAVADMDGDGLPEIGAVHLNGKFRCYRGATGEVAWEHAIPAGGGSHVAAGDIDGDGAGEFIFIDADGALTALRGGAKEEKDRVLWNLPLGTSGAPILADIDGDGKIEIALVGGDGKLKVIGNRTKP